MKMLYNQPEKILDLAGDGLTEWTERMRYQMSEELAEKLEQAILRIEQRYHYKMSRRPFANEDAL